MQGDLCDRPERNARPFDDDSGHGPLEDGIIFNSKNDALDRSLNHRVRQKEILIAFLAYLGV